MYDKNGVEIKVGDIVEIRGGYHKCQNGLYFVENNEESPDWSGNSCCLMKISKNGKISTAARNLAFWPLTSYVRNKQKREEARIWNKKNAEIEVKTGISQTEVSEYFLKKVQDMTIDIEYEKNNYGEDSPRVLDFIAIKTYYENVVRTLSSETEMADSDCM